MRLSHADAAQDVRARAQHRVDLAAAHRRGRLAAGDARAAGVPHAGRGAGALARRRAAPARVPGPTGRGRPRPHDRVPAQLSGEQASTSSGSCSCTSSTTARRPAAKPPSRSPSWASPRATSTSPSSCAAARTTSGPPGLMALGPLPGPLPHFAALRGICGRRDEGTTGPNPLSPFPRCGGTLRPTREGGTEARLSVSGRGRERSGSPCPSRPTVPRSAAAGGGQGVRSPSHPRCQPGVRSL